MKSKGETKNGIKFKMVAKDFMIKQFNEQHEH